MSKSRPHFSPELFNRELLRWFKATARALPWRATNHWYPVFLSEILLQQTQVEQALPYYRKLIDRYPTVYDLAQADEQELLTLWAGLGYYARARHLLKAAGEIVARFHGQFPSDLKEALSLPGIGPYTAAAILSIAFGQPLPVVDGNVLRVVTRLFALRDDIRQTVTKNKVRGLLQEIIDDKAPGVFNEALMELGALVCTPQNPDCQSCPVAGFCLAKERGLTGEIPFKSPPRERRRAAHFVLVVRFRAKFLLVRRERPGLLSGMWEFPVLETRRLIHSNQKIKQHVQALTGAAVSKLTFGPELQHIYSHIHLRYQPVLAELEQAPRATLTDQKAVWCRAEEFERYAIHRAHHKVLEHEETAAWFSS